MDPLKVSAQFVAFTWYCNLTSCVSASPREAMRLARKNWPAFLPSAHEGLGRLLIRLARARSKRQKAAVS